MEFRCGLPNSGIQALYTYWMTRLVMGVGADSDVTRQCAT
jgi:hypothetical protein